MEHGVVRPRAPKKYAEVFEERFPYYLAMGMTYEQYWDGDCTLVKYYRRAEELKQRQMNYQAWLNGLYVYKAIGALTPIMHAFAKQGTKAEPYESQPIALTAAELKERREEEARRAAMKFAAFVEAKNKQLEQRRRSIHVDHD